MAHFASHSGQHRISPRGGLHSYFKTVIACICTTPTPVAFGNGQTDELAEPEVLKPTSYLDGLRGLVAIFVFIRHFLLPWEPDLDHGYGQSGEHTEWLRLPPFRILYAGPNVPLFLLTSGYVMSLKPLDTISEKRYSDLLGSVVSSIFRRPLRLFLPPIISTLGIVFAVQMGLMATFPYETIPAYVPRHPERLENFWSQINDWLKFVFTDLTNPWTWKSSQSLYGPHLWTIPVQFRCSMILFLLHIAFAKIRRKLRDLLLGGLILYCVLYGRWDVSLYLTGFLMASAFSGRSSCIQSESTDIPLSQESSTEQKNQRTYHTTSLWISLLIGGIYFGSFPRHRDGTGASGYQYLYGICPDYRYWHSLGAVLILWALKLSESFQKLLNLSILRGMGRISFSFYILHEPLLHMIGYRAVLCVWRALGSSTALTYQLGIIIAFAITLVISAWFANIFHRMVDTPCAKFTRKFELWCR